MAGIQSPTGGKKKKELEMWANAQRDGRLAALCSTPQSLADAHY